MRTKTINLFTIAVILFTFLTGIRSTVNAQTQEDSIMRKLNALRDDYIGKIKAIGYKPSLNAPVIVLDNPRSYGNYDDKNNVLHMGDWKTLPAAARVPFIGFAKMIGNGMTAEKFFNLAVHKWIFIHELGHWWRACRKQTALPYDEEKDANRITSSYWKERDPAFYKLMLVVFNGVVAHSPNPVPAGLNKEKYLNDNYQKLPGGAAYSWYQSIMIVEVSKEKPFETFRQAVKHAGKPLAH
jgi:hypothetical protein